MEWKGVHLSWEMTYKLGCTDMDTDTGTIYRHEQFLKNYNMIRQIGHNYNTGMTQIQHGYDIQMKCSCILAYKCRCLPKLFVYNNILSFVLYLFFVSDPH